MCIRDRSYAEPGTGAEAGRSGLAVGSAVLSADGSVLTQWRVIFRPVSYTHLDVYKRQL